MDLPPGKRAAAMSDLPALPVFLLQLAVEYDSSAKRTCSKPLIVENIPVGPKESSR
jgi:hypothetical protein